MSRGRSRRTRRGFTLIEVLAAFIIALLMLAPIATIISGVAGSLGGLNRSADRRAEFRRAMDAASALTPLRSGRARVGDFTIEVTPYDFDRDDDLRAQGWALYRLIVSSGNGRAVLETVRIGRT